MNNSYQKGVVFSFNLYYTYGVINKGDSNYEIYKKVIRRICYCT